jgi:SAM-dependent methyltransferase
MYTSGAYAQNNPTWHSEDSPWKADHISRMLTLNNVQPATVVEVGCGRGLVLSELSKRFPETKFEGFDVSPQALTLAAPLAQPNLSFAKGDIAEVGDDYDLLLAIDVFEHVPDYLGFLDRCSSVSARQIYHIPLDISVLHVMRGAITFNRKSVGHLHYFTAESAIETLESTGHRVVDYFYTSAALERSRSGLGIRHAVANAVRRPVGALSPRLSARLLGGYSLLILCESRS